VTLLWRQLFYFAFTGPVGTAAGPLDESDKVINSCTVCAGTFRHCIIGGQRFSLSVHSYMTTSLCREHKSRACNHDCGKATVGRVHKIPTAPHFSRLVMITVSWIHIFLHLPNNNGKQNINIRNYPNN
jgi:hypothetical protein